MPAALSFVAPPAPNRTLHHTSSVSALRITCWDCPPRNTRDASLPQVRLGPACRSNSCHGPGCRRSVAVHIPIPHASTSQIHFGLRCEVIHTPSVCECTPRRHPPSAPPPPMQQGSRAGDPFHAPPPRPAGARSFLQTLLSGDGLREGPQSGSRRAVRAPLRPPFGNLPIRAPRCTYGRTLVFHPPPSPRPHIPLCYYHYVLLRPGMRGGRPCHPWASPGPGRMR